MLVFSERLPLIEPNLLLEFRRGFGSTEGAALAVSDINDVAEGMEPELVVGERALKEESSVMRTEKGKQKQNKKRTSFVSIVTTLFTSPAKAPLSIR
jgi:hypothetical protein